MALVVTLSLIVLVTIAAMAFFARATANRAVESSRTNQVLTQQLVNTALDNISGQYLREITDPARSTVTQAGNASLYLPTTNTFAVPQRALPAFANSTNFANLVRRSASESTNGVGEPQASSHSTASPARNGRAIGVQRWNAPALLGGGGFTSSAQAPYWIYVNKDGQVTSVPSTNTIGRFAYNVYNIGGLLDANIAGYPASVAPGSVEFNEIKGTLAGADLSLIPGVSNANAFVSWRNASHVATSGAYASAVSDSAKNSFLRPPVGDQRFGGRMDLIRLAQAGNTGLTIEALPFLTTFSIALNAPSFFPASTRPRVQNQSPALPSYGLDDDINPNLLTPRVATSFLRADGAAAIVGEPLLKKRFPLNRLALLENAPGQVDTSSTIYQLFGLTRSSADDPWVYNHGATDRILTLQEVAAANREPDFFELLQASISLGSLGKSMGKTHAYGNATSNDVPLDPNTYYQIIAIGANLIDQYDADSYPTAIRFNGVDFSGIENLPYLTRIFTVAYRPSAANASEVDLYVQPEVWNPHQGATSPPSPSSANNMGPDEFRFVLNGSNVTAHGHVPSGIVYTHSATGSRQISFGTGSTNFSEPKLLTHGVATATDARDAVTTPGGTAFVGMFMGRESGPVSDPYQILPSPALSYYLQYKNSSGAWVTYSRMENTTQFLDASTGAPAEIYPGLIWPYLAKSDPRSQRFGFILGTSSGAPTTPGVTLRPSYADSGAVAWDKPAGTYPGWLVGATIFGSVPAYHLGLLTKNDSASLSYHDPDGERRLGDSAYSVGQDGEPMDTGNLASRPVILNRPFRSVAEMGYAFRDIPWKSLDFFTDKSGDAALLDVFTVFEPSSMELASGVVDLNTNQSTVLAAILAGTEKRQGSMLQAAAESKDIAAEIVSLTTASPLVNRAEIATTILPELSASLFQTTADAAIKTRREVVARSLVDVGQVRTWNLLIDVIAQSGRFLNGTNPDSFVVDGERRIWQSIAIDRPTAKVIYSYREVINE